MCTPASNSDSEEIYDKAAEYWQQASQDVDGMLGGFAHLHPADISVSRTFIGNLKRKGFLTSTDYALDCGAGIGRVTKHLLLPLFNKVDMEDVVENLIVKSDEYIGKNPKVGEKFVEGLQTFAPPQGRYDLIWIQWVSGHLTDTDFVSFFERCKEGLKPDGVIVLKDNLSAQQSSEFDNEDNSWTRPEDLILELFEKAGLRLVARNLQTGFPKGMYEVKMFALKP
ncbi:unnamed protein product [Auanema sp. JU1783]|nr:unnamed protein product [Auanema sp. JU1783]